MAHLIEDAPLKSKGLELGSVEQIRQFFNRMLVFSASWRNFPPGTFKPVKTRTG